MKISKKSQYGLRSMIYLAKRDRRTPFSLKDISKAELIPFNYLEKIFSELEKAGLVKSRKGRLGGYFLSRDPLKITVVEIIEALEGKISLIECKGCRKAEKCKAKSAWDELHKAFYSTLKSINLSKLAK